MSQSKKQSMMETMVSVAIGYGVALLTQIVVFPLFGMEVKMSDNLAIGAIFTVVSIIRGYCIRRLFNKLHGRK
jgi:putative Mn2+ efflux pump MntP